MTKKVKYSSATIAWTLLLIAAYAATAIYFVKREDTIVWVGLIVVISVWNIFALLYAPLSVSVDANTLNIYTVLRRKRIRIADIASAELCTPTMAEKKILSSGGYFGYWDGSANVTSASISPITAKAPTAFWCGCATGDNTCSEVTSPAP